MSQTALADLLGTKPSYISRVESGKENLTVGALARFGAALDADLHVSFRLRPTPQMTSLAG